MHETEFSTSKMYPSQTLAENKAHPFCSSLSRLSLLTVLLLALLVCSCVKVSRQAIATTDETPLAINARPEANRINLNTASARDLEALPGVGKVLAERILAHRTQYGPFRRAEHLMMVRGVSDNKFRAIRVRVAVE
jgi:competence protein ComEA